MKNNNGLKKYITVGYDIKDNGCLPLVLTIAVRFAGYGGYLLPVINITAKELERQGSFI
jgi:hypothetical protein